MHKNRFTIFLTIILVFVLFGCSDESKEIVKDNVELSLIENGVNIENNSSYTIGYFAVDQETLALIDWAAVCGVDNQIVSNESKNVEASSIQGYQSGKNIIIYYWECPKAEDEGVYSSLILAE